MVWVTGNGLEKACVSRPGQLLHCIDCIYLTNKLCRLSCVTWSPCAWRPMIMDLVQPGISRGMVLQIIGSRKTVPPRILRIVPFGLSHIFFSLNSTQFNTRSNYNQFQPFLCTSSSAVAKRPCDASSVSS